TRGLPPGSSWVFGLLGMLEALVCCGALGCDAQRDLVGDADAVAFEGDDFFRVIGQDPNVFQAEVDQDLGADAGFVLDHALAGGFAVELAALMEMDLRERARLVGGLDAEAASGVMEIKEDAAILLGDGAERTGDQLRAVTG